MKFKSNKYEGITLIEIIIYVALFVIFISGVVSIGLQSVSIRVKASIEQRVVENSNFVMRRLVYEIRNATGINSLTAQSISLATADASRNPVVITKTGNKITIGWTGGTTCTLASPCDLTSDEVVVNKLTFANMSDTGNKSASVKFDLTVSSANSGGRQEWNYSTSNIGSAELTSK